MISKSNPRLANSKSDFRNHRRTDTLLWLIRLSIAFLLFSPARGQDKCPGYTCEREPKRIALVIGNANYSHYASIPSAITDANLMRDRLTELGFEVELHTDVPNNFEFWHVILPGFRQKLTSDDFIVFYFSGHGFAHGADNFVAPTELPASIPEQRVTDNAIALESVKIKFESHSPGLILFIIDACRSIAVPIVKATDANYVAKGDPAPMQNLDPTINTLIAYATEPGHVALGSTEPKELSPFTQALTSKLTTVGKRFTVVFREAAADLIASTLPPQVAGTFFWSRTDPYLKPTAQNLEEDKEAWLTALTSERRPNIQIFEQLNSASRFLTAARKWLADHSSDDVTSGFTRASPVAIDRAWRSTNTEMVAIRRLSVPLAFTRTLSEDQQPTLREFSDAEIGLVRSGIKRNELGELRTGQDFVTDISPRGELHTDFYRNSLAYSIASIDAHGTMVATRPLVGRAEPKPTAKVIEHIPTKAVLQIRDVTLGEDESVWIKATDAESLSLFYFKLESEGTPAVLELGRSVKEILVPARPTNIQLIDPAPLNSAIAELKAQGWKITWISLSTAPTADEAEQETREARMANAEYILKRSDIPLFVTKGTTPDIGDRITSVSGREGIMGNSVRIRFFGIK